MADEAPDNTSWARFRTIARAVALYCSPIWVLLAVCALLLAIKAIALLWARKHGSPSQRVAAGWQAVTATAMQSGLSVHGTRNEQAQAIAKEMSLMLDALVMLGKEADYVTFSGNTAPTQCPRDLLHDQRNRRRIVLMIIPPFFRRWDSYFPPQVHTVYYPKV